MSDVVTVTEMRRHLNINGAAFDTRIQEHIDAAVATIAEYCGPLEPTTVTERIRNSSGSAVIVLRESPIVDVTSVTPYGGTALDLDTLDLNEESGVIRLQNGGTFAGSSTVVVYRAGRSECPEDLKLAVKEMVRYTWGGSAIRGGGGKPGSQSSDTTSNTVPGAADDLPFRVSSLIAAHRQFGIR